MCLCGIGSTGGIASVEVGDALIHQPNQCLYNFSIGAWLHYYAVAWENEKSYALLRTTKVRHLVMVCQLENSSIYCIDMYKPG